MADRAWKQFERDMASLFGGVRHPANSGHRVDFETDTAVGQCKLVQRMSLEDVTQLAEEIARIALPKLKAGVVCLKVRRGAGKKSSALVVMTTEVYEAMHGKRTEQIPPRLHTDCMGGPLNPGQLYRGVAQTGVFHVAGCPHSWTVP